MKTAGALENGLRGGGFLPAVAKSGEEGLSLASTEDFDVIVLDWLLPGRDGLEVLKTLRSRGCRTPVPCSPLARDPRRRADGRIRRDGERLNC